MFNYLDTCNQILSERGPLLGSELCQIISDSAGVTPNNARQIIYRLKKLGKLLSTDPVSFGNNQFIYFLSGHNIVSKIKEVIPDNRKVLHRIYQAFVDQNGFLFWSDFVKISGAPLKTTILKQKTASQIYEDLLSLGLVKPIKYFNQIPVVIAEKNWVPKVHPTEPNMFKRYEDTILSEQLNKDLLKWLERINIAGWNSTFLHKIDDEDPCVNDYFWDAHGFTYIWGLYTTDETNNFLDIPIVKKGSLILIDSVITRPLRIYDITSFISRLQVQNGRIAKNRNYRIIPICFMSRIDTDALNLARKKGIIIISIAEVFGTRIFEVLDTVRNLDPRNVDPDSLAKVLAVADQSGQDGKFGSMKGYLFNFLVATIFNSFGWQTRIGVNYEFGGKRCECDVIAFEENEGIMIVCECKGYNSDTSIELGNTEEPDTVKRFFERTIYIAGKASNWEVFPVFITSATFSPDAVEYLEKLSQSKRIQRMSEALNRFPNKIYYDKNELTKLFSKKKGLSTQKQILKEFYTTRKRKD